MHALRKVHRALETGGILLDMHPIPPSARAEARGKSLGDFDDVEFMEVVRSTENGLERTVLAGLFAFERELEFDWLERYESGEELIEAANDWDGCKVPSEVAERIRQAEPPVDIWEHVVLRRFRTL